MKACHICKLHHGHEINIEISIEADIDIDIDMDGERGRFMSAREEMLREICCIQCLSRHSGRFYFLSPGNFL